MAPAWISAAAISGLALGTGASAACDLPALPVNSVETCETSSSGLADTNGMKHRLQACCELAFRLERYNPVPADATFDQVMDFWGGPAQIPDCRDYFTEYDGGAWGRRFIAGYECARNRWLNGPGVPAPTSLIPAPLCFAAAKDFCGPPKVASVPFVAYPQPCGYEVPAVPQGITTDCKAVADRLDTCCNAALSSFSDDEIQNVTAKKIADILEFGWLKVQCNRFGQVFRDDRLWFNRFKTGYECAQSRGEDGKKALCQQASCDVCAKISGVTHIDSCPPRPKDTCLFCPPKPAPAIQAAPTPAPSKAGGAEGSTNTSPVSACGPMPPLPASPESKCKDAKKSLEGCCKDAFKQDKGGLPENAEIREVKQYLTGGECAEYYSDWGRRFEWGYACARDEGTEAKDMCKAATNNLCTAQGQREGGTDGSAVVIGKDGASRAVAGLNAAAAAAAAWASIVAARAV